MVFRIVLVGVIAQCWTPGFVVADGSATEKLWVKEYLKNKVTPASIDSVSSYEGSNITSSDYNDDISSPEIPSDFSQKYFWPRISTTPKEPNSNEATEVQGVETTTKSKLEKTPTRNNSDSSYEGSKITSSDYNDDISPPDIPSDFSQKYFWPRISTTPKEPNTDGATEAQDVKSKTRSESKKGKRRKREADTTRRTKKPAARRLTRKPTNTTTKRRTRKPTNTTSKRRTRNSKATTTKSDVGSSTVSTKRYATRISFMGFPVIVGSIEEEQPTTMRKEIPSTTPRTEGPIKTITKIAFWGGMVEVPAEHATKKPVLLETASPAQKLSEGTELTTERKPTLDVTKLAFGMGFVPFARQTEEKTEAASDVLTTTTVVVTARPTASADHSTTTAKSNEKSTTTVRMAP